MNDNPGGTPNPLNPNPGANDGPQPLDTAAVQPSTNTSPQPVDPMNRPMKKAADQTTETKPKKTGLIIAILACLLLAVGCGVAAILLMFSGKGGDPVANAMDKLMSGKTASNVVVSGDVDIDFGDASAPFKKAEINFDAKLISRTTINSLDVAVKLTPQNNPLAETGAKDISFGFSEVHAENGDLYLKVDGAADALTGLVGDTTKTTTSTNTLDEIQSLRMEAEAMAEELEAIDAYDIIDSDTIDSLDAIDTLDALDTLNTIDTTDTFDIEEYEPLATMLGVAGFIDGEWIRLSAAELEAFSVSVVEDNPLSCLVDFTSNIDTRSNSALELYKKNPFVISTTDNMKVVSRRDPIYRLGFDGEKMANYIDSVQNAALLDDLYSCLGVNGYAKITAEDVAEVLEGMPEIYVEVNGDNVFTRLYLSYEIENPLLVTDCSSTLLGEDDCVETETTSTPENTTVTIDLTFDYPASVNISEPAEYQNFSDLIQEIFGNSNWGG